MALFYILLLIFALGMGLLLRSLLGLLLAYLAPKSPRILHSSEECPWLWMIQIFDFPDRLSTYRFLRFPELSPFYGGFYDDAASPLLCLMLQERLDSYRVGF